MILLTDIQSYWTLASIWQQNWQADEQKWGSLVKQEDAFPKSGVEVALHISSKV
jgi:hypothetical protein